MVVYRIYYLMIDRASKNVSGVWKVLHLWTQFMAASSGIVSAWYFHIILQGFGHNCPLYAKVEFSLLKPNSIGYNILPKNVTINMRESTWGKDMYCQCSFTVWMISFIGSLILCTFFLWSKNGGSGNLGDSFTQPWKHVLPTLLVSICFMGAVTVGTYFASNGLNMFCKEFRAYIDTDRCNYKIDTFSLPFANKILNINQAINMVRSCAPFCVIAWISHTVILVVRICISPDFDVQIIKITGIKQTDKRHASKASNLDMESHSNIKRLPSSVVGFRGSLPSLHALFSSQLRSPQFEISSPHAKPKDEEVVVRESLDTPPITRHSLKHLKRPTEYKHEKADPDAKTSYILPLDKIISVASTVEMRSLPLAEKRKPDSEGRKIVQPGEAFRSLTRGTPIKEIPLTMSELLLLQKSQMRPNFKHTRFVTEETVSSPKSVLSSDTDGQDQTPDSTEAAPIVIPSSILRKPSKPQIPPMEEILPKPKEEPPPIPKEEAPPIPKEEPPPKPKNEPPAEPKEEPPPIPKEEPPPIPKEEPPPIPKEETPPKPKDEPPAESKQEPPPKPKEEPPAEPKEQRSTKESLSSLDKSDSIDVPTSSPSPEALQALREQRIQTPPTTPTTPSKTLQTVKEEPLVNTPHVRRLPSTVRIREPDNVDMQANMRSRYRRPPDPMPPPFTDDRPGRLTGYMGRHPSARPAHPAPSPNAFQGVLPINYRASLLMANSANNSGAASASTSRHRRQEGEADQGSNETGEEGEVPNQYNRPSERRNGRRHGSYRARRFD